MIAGGLTQEDVSAAAELTTARATAMKNFIVNCRSVNLKMTHGAKRVEEHVG